MNRISLLLTATKCLVILSITLLAGCDRAGEVNTPELDSGSGQGRHSLQVLIDWKAEPTYAGFFIAKENGYYSELGLDIEIIEGNGATVAAQLIGVGNRYQIGSSSGVATAIARSKGIPIKSIGVLYHNLPTVIYSLEQNSIRTPDDLYGKKIGLITGSTTLDEYRALALVHNLDRSKIDELDVGWDVTPLLSGQVDGLMNYAELTPVELRLQGYRVQTLKLADFGVNAYGLNLIANEKFLVESPEVARLVVEGTVKGYQFVHDHPDQAATVFLKLFPEKSEQFVRESMKVVASQLNGEDLGKQTRQGWKSTIETLDKLDLLPAPLRVDDLAAEGFIAK